MKYTMTLLAAMTPNEVVGAQMIQGGVDNSLFENFVYRVVAALLKDPVNKGRRIVVYLDNARIHKCQAVYDAMRKLGCCLVFAAQYSPFLMPIEMLFNEVKLRLK